MIGVGADWQTFATEYAANCCRQIETSLEMQKSLEEIWHALKQTNLRFREAVYLRQGSKAKQFSGIECSLRDGIPAQVEPLPTLTN